MVFLDRRGQYAECPRFGPKLFPHNLTKTDDMGTERLALTAPQHEVDLYVFAELSGLMTVEGDACRTDVLRGSRVPIAFPEFAIAHRQFNRKALGLPVLAWLNHPHLTIR